MICIKWGENTGRYCSSLVQSCADVICSLQGAYCCGLDTCLCRLILRSSLSVYLFPPALCPCLHPDQRPLAGGIHRRTAVPITWSPSLPCRRCGSVSPAHAEAQGCRLPADWQGGRALHQSWQDVCSSWRHMQESAGAAAAGGKQVRLRSVYHQNSYDVCAAWRYPPVQRLLGKCKGVCLGHVLLKLCLFSVCSRKANVLVWSSWQLAQGQRLGIGSLAFHFASRYSGSVRAAHTEQQKWVTTGGCRESSQAGYGGPVWTVGGQGCGWQKELKNRLTGKAVLACFLPNQSQKICGYYGRNSWVNGYKEW